MPQVNLTTLRILHVVDDPGQLRRPDQVARNTAMIARLWR